MTLLLPEQDETDNLSESMLNLRRNICKKSLLAWKLTLYPTNGHTLDQTQNATVASRPTLHTRPDTRRRYWMLSENCGSEVAR